ncbi:MAG: PQQ-binding-like beta-propeller repeat protein [Kofleriaceae bacterium]|nr:PQQ-binding-like beta-propeller repeat protein [Kofleriaceae bacterium]
MRVGLIASVIVCALAVPQVASAKVVHGLVYDDQNDDGQPSAGEPGVGGAVVALGVRGFVVTDASGQFDIEVPDALASGIAWVRVPDGFRPGPAWQRWDGTADIDLALHRLDAPIRGPLTFVVGADTHIPATQELITGADLANAATMATALETPPAFFTVLGDITQGNREAEFALVDQALAGIGVPWIPVPGNHDWYDGGAAWFAHYGPDNYSFDIGDVHFVVWNMAMSEDDIRAYLGAELSHVPSTMTVVALTHAPPSNGVTDALRDLGVDYVLTGHAHSNRVVDRDGLIELNTEPMLMGGLDFTPAGYRVITLDGGRLSSYHRTTLDEPMLTIVGPARGQCTPAKGAELVVAAELDGGTANLTARVDCATPIAMRSAGGMSWVADLPALSGGPHAITVEATTPSGTSATATTTIEVCTPAAAPPKGPDWVQLGGDPDHAGAREHEIVPPLVTRWTAAVGGHVITASPAIARDKVYVAVTDLGDGNSGGVVALDLVTGALKWRVATAKPLRGGLVVVLGTVIAPQIDGVVLGLDAETGAVRWRDELTPRRGAMSPEAGALFGAPVAESGDVFVGHQRTLAAIAGDVGTPLWVTEPVPDGMDSQSAAAVAVGSGIAVGTFNRALGGVIAWDRDTGKRLWSYLGAETVAINASPIISDDSIYIVSGADEVTSLDHAGQVRWRTKLDPDGFDWGNATIGTPAFASGILVVPTLYRDLVALDAATGVELWRRAAVPGPLHTTHYRGAGEAGFAASPVITGDLVWAVDTSGKLTAFDLASGATAWTTDLGVPVLAGLAVSGDWLIAASYDGSVRALVPTKRERPPVEPPTCAEVVAPAGCCDASGTPIGALVLTLGVAGVIWRRRR